MKNLVTYGLIATLIAGSGLISVAPSADAKPWQTRASKRQVKQNNRIDNGLKDGSLTGKEYIGLQKRQSKLARKKRQAVKSGGELTKKEAVKLEMAQDKMSQQIFKQKHDGQSRD